MDKDVTPRSDVDLCHSCSQSFIREGYNGDKVVLCTWVTPPLRIKGPTVKCGSYRHKNEADVFDLEKIAWIISTDPKGKIGFRQWKEMSAEERAIAGVRTG